MGPWFPPFENREGWGSHYVVLLYDESLKEKYEYIRLNPVRSGGRGRPPHKRKGISLRTGYSNSICSNPKPCNRLRIVDAAFTWAFRKMPSAIAASNICGARAPARV